MKFWVCSLLLVIGCTRHDKEVRVPAAFSGPEEEIFRNSAFKSQSDEVRGAAERIYYDRLSAERAYRQQDPAEYKGTVGFRRDTHGKTHACPKATFEVNKEIPITMRSGIFAQPGAKFNAWIRFANGVGQIRHDLYADARSLSIKVMGVPGKKAYFSFPDEEVSTHDFLFNNAPTFFVGNAEEAEEFFKADTNGDISGYFISTMNPFGATYKKRVAFNALYITKIEDNLLKATYWSGSPYALGGQRVRYVISPCRDKDYKAYAGLPALNADEKEYARKMKEYTQNYSPLYNGNPDFHEMGTVKYAQFLAAFPFALKLGSDYADSFNPASRDYFRENLTSDLSAGREGCFDFGVQPYENEDTTPLAQPVAVWRSKPIWVAKISIPRQEGIATPERVQFCEQMSFSPYHAVISQAPVGEINAIRGMVYKAVSEYRHRMNKTQTGEPLNDFSEKLVSPVEAASFYSSPQK